MAPKYLFAKVVFLWCGVTLELPKFLKERTLTTDDREQINSFRPVNLAEMSIEGFNLGT